MFLYPVYRITWFNIPAKLSPCLPYPLSLVVSVHTKLLKCKKCMSEEHPSILHFWGHERNQEQNASCKDRQQERYYGPKKEECYRVHGKSHVKSWRKPHLQDENEKWMFCRKNMLCSKCMNKHHNGLPCRLNNQSDRFATQIPP